MRKVFVLGLCMLLILGLSGCVSMTGETADSSLSDVKSKGKLVIGTYPVVKPMSFIDENGKITGHDIEIIKEIASELGVETEIKNILFQNLITSVKSGDIDVIACVLTITPERSEEILFSIPYFNAGQTIVAKKERGFSYPEDIDMMVVGAQKGTTAETVGREYTNSSLLRVYDEWENALMDLENDEIDAILIDYVMAISYVKEDPELEIVADPLSQEYYGFGTKLGNNALMDEINKILRDMKRTGKLDEIKDKWLK